MPVTITNGEIPNVLPDWAGGDVGGYAAVMAAAVAAVVASNRPGDGKE